MSWNATWPEGAKSVKTNQTTGAENTTYIKTTMNNDHYWDDSTNNDGHHHVVQMTKVDTVPDLSTGMEGLIYLKSKLAAEAVDNQDVQPFFKDNTTVGSTATTQIMQLLGIRAMGVFDRTEANGPVTLQYSHNCTVSRTAKGAYTVAFGSALPSNNYLVFGDCIRFATDNNKPGSFVLYSAKTLANKTTANFKFRTYSAVNGPLVDGAYPSSYLIDPTQTWFVVFGG